MSIKTDVEIAELQGKVAGLEQTVETLKTMVMQEKVEVSMEKWGKAKDKRRKPRSDKGTQRK